ncbi:MAG: hypothetical protein ABIF85_01975 [Nanoarchaeota archaeon]|nr:hypothetical protein [Nanoarchaeota archaeon]MBU4300887.1 hypothetical protein [Nanoarchaeota archaeon]MBU4451407.1 hypothetical protein [Nanoarchaeota archaeon]MCG2724519.1 hypothetical protein [archaeon]
MKVAIILAFVLTLLVSSDAFAWQWETHSTLAEKVCRDFNCGCIEEIRDAAVIPDRDFKDTINHHCYLLNRSVSEVLKGLKLIGEFHDNLSVSCEPSEYYDCPKKNNCPALEKMQFWLEKSEKALGCEQWKNVGIASHYYFDSRVFWHKTQGEDYNKCHEPFEGKVEKKFDANDGSDWTITACDAQENYANMVSYVNDFEHILAASGAPEKVADAPLLSECGRWCKLWMWLSALF